MNRFCASVFLFFVPAVSVLAVLPEFFSVEKNSPVAMTAVPAPMQIKKSVPFKVDSLVLKFIRDDMRDFLEFRLRSWGDPPESLLEIFTNVETSHRGSCPRVDENYLVQRMMDFIPQPYPMTVMGLITSQPKLAIQGFRAGTIDFHSGESWNVSCVSCHWQKHVLTVH